MKILVLNSGSSSLKFQLIDVESQTVESKGLVERIGLEMGAFSYTSHGEKHMFERRIANHTEGLRLVMEALVNKENGVLKSLQEIQVRPWWGILQKQPADR